MIMCVSAARSVSLPSGAMALMTGFTSQKSYVTLTVIGCPALGVMQSMVNMSSWSTTSAVLLSAARAAWAGRLKDWLARDGSLLAFLAGLGGMALTPALGALMLVALAWFIIGSLKQDRRGGIAALLGGAAAFTEMGVQLAINTLSFVRVGAFALAHAGLGSAVVSMMLMLDNFLARALVLLVGNVVIIGLEGLVVSIQTTRLVLFEFFVRFFRAEGRPFRPMLLPK